jgi:hypothetical protein
MKTNYFKIIFVSIALFAFLGIGNAFAECDPTSLTVTGSATAINGVYVQGADISGYDAWYGSDSKKIYAYNDDGWFYMIGNPNPSVNPYYYRDGFSIDVIGSYKSNTTNLITSSVALTVCEDEETAIINPLFSLSQGKATSSAIELSASVGTISTSVFSSFSGYLYLILGILIAWFIIQTIYNFYKDFIEKDKKFEKQTKELIQRGNQMTEKIKEYKTKK